MNAKKEGGKKMRELHEIWNLIINYGIATNEELHLVTDIMGYSIETLNAVIYARTSYRDIEQYLEELLKLYEILNV